MGKLRVTAKGPPDPQDPDWHPGLGQRKAGSQDRAKTPAKGAWKTDFCPRSPDGLVMAPVPLRACCICPWAVSHLLMLTEG